jgi:ABC-2 type transport system ATP-binding protein
MIKTENLTKKFGDFTAVDNLTISVEPGELFALLGPNGSGKTTTVRMLACLIAPTSGRAEIAGRIVGQDCNEIRGRVGLLTEAPGLYEQLSAWQNLMIFANLYEIPEPEKQVERFLRLLDLWEHRKQPTGGFSKGMKQKVAIARSLLHEPELVFLDEPTSGLDPAAAKTVRDFLAELKAAGRTIFLTTHNLDEAERLADRVGVINHRLVALDTPEHLRNRLFGRRTRVRLDNPLPELAEVACEVPGVTGVAWQDSTLLVDLSDPERENPALVAALVGAGARVQAVTEDRVSLEQIYLQLVGEESE